MIKQIQEFAQRLINGPNSDAEAESFVKESLATAEDILREEDAVAGPRGTVRFDAVMERLQATEFYHPTQTAGPFPKIGSVGRPERKLTFATRPRSNRQST